MAGALQVSRCNSSGEQKSKLNELWSGHMARNILNNGVIAENSDGIGTVTRKMVRERAAELAVINGRSAKDVSKSDLDQAKRELTGGSDMDPQEARLKSMPDTHHWDPTPPSTGRELPESENEDEDGEERSDSERLVEEGVAEAEHDQMLQATKKAAKENR
jgi:hypothetical protein